MYVVRTKKQVVRAFLRNKNYRLIDRTKKTFCNGDSLIDNSISIGFEVARLYSNHIVLVKRDAYNYLQEYLIYLVKKSAARYGFLVIEVNNFFSLDDSYEFQNYQHSINLGSYLLFLEDHIQIYKSNSFIDTSKQIRIRLNKLNVYLTTFADRLDKSNTIINKAYAVNSNPRYYLYQKGLKQVVTISKIQYDSDAYILQKTFEIYQKIKKNWFSNISEKWRFYYRSYILLKKIYYSLSLSYNKTKYRRLYVFYPKYRKILSYFLGTERNFLSYFGLTPKALKLLTKTIQYNRNGLGSDWLNNRIDYIGDNLGTVYVRPIYYIKNRFNKVFVGVEFSNSIFLTLFEFKFLMSIVENYDQWSIYDFIYLNNRIKFIKIAKGEVYFQRFKVKLDNLLACCNYQ